MTGYPSDDDPRITLALGSQDYRHLVDTLDRHYNLVLVDTGTGILDDAIQGILEEADQLVVVMPPALDGGRVAAMSNSSSSNGSSCCSRMGQAMPSKPAMASAFATPRAPTPIVTSPSTVCRPDMSRKKP